MSGSSDDLPSIFSQVARSSDHQPSIFSQGLDVVDVFQKTPPSSGDLQEEEASAEVVSERNCSPFRSLFSQQSTPETLPSPQVLQEEPVEEAQETAETSSPCRPPSATNSEFFVISRPPNEVLLISSPCELLKASTSEELDTNGLSSAVIDGVGSDSTAASRSTPKSNGTEPFEVHDAEFEKDVESSADSDFPGFLPSQAVIDLSVKDRVSIILPEVAPLEPELPASEPGDLVSATVINLTVKQNTCDDVLPPSPSKSPVNLVVEIAKLAPEPVVNRGECATNIGCDEDDEVFTPESSVDVSAVGRGGAESDRDEDADRKISEKSEEEDSPLPQREDTERKLSEQDMDGGGAAGCDSPRKRKRRGKDEPARKYLGMRAPSHKPPRARLNAEFRPPFEKKS